MIRVRELSLPLSLSPSLSLSLLATCCQASVRIKPSHHVKFREGEKSSPITRCQYVNTHTMVHSSTTTTTFQHTIITRIESIDRSGCESFSHSLNTGKYRNG